MYFFIIYTFLFLLSGIFLIRITLVQIDGKLGNGAQCDAPILPVQKISPFLGTGNPTLFHIGDARAAGAQAPKSTIKKKRVNSPIPFHQILRQLDAAGEHIIEPLLALRGIHPEHLPELRRWLPLLKITDLLPALCADPPGIRERQDQGNDYPLTLQNTPAGQPSPLVLARDRQSGI